MAAAAGKSDHCRVVRLGPKVSYHTHRADFATNLVGLALAERAVEFVAGDLAASVLCQAYQALADCLRGDLLGVRWFSFHHKVAREEEP